MRGHGHGAEGARGNATEGHWVCVRAGQLLFGSCAITLIVVKETHRDDSFRSVYIQSSCVGLSSRIHTNGLDRDERGAG